MFFRRSPRRRRSSGIASIVNYARTRWSHTNVDRVFSFKHGYARRLMMECLEERHLLASATLSEMNPSLIGDWSELRAESSQALWTTDTPPTAHGFSGEGNFYWHFDEQVPLASGSFEYVIHLPPRADSDAFIEMLVGGVDPLLPDYAASVIPGLGPRYIWLRPDEGVINPDPDVEQVISSLDGVEWYAPILIHGESNSRVYLTDEVAVALNPEVDPEQFFTTNFSTWRRFFNNQYIATVASGGGLGALSLANQLNADPRVEWASPNIHTDRRTDAIPNDPLFAGNQWTLLNTGQTGARVGADARVSAAWDVTTGSPDIVIAVLDNGVQLNHPDLRIFVNAGEIAGNGLDDDANGFIDDVNGWDFADNDANPNPSVAADNHGTAVAGIAAAIGNNAIGVAGVSHNAQVLPIKIAEDSAGNQDGFITDANIARAVYYAAGIVINAAGIPTGTWRGADILNNSWSGGAPNALLSAAFNFIQTNARNGLGVASFNSTGNGADGYVSRNVAINPGSWVFEWRYTKNGSGAAGDDRGWLANVALPNNITERFDSVGIPAGWSTVGSAPWSVVDDPAHTFGTGRFVARSGLIGNNQSSNLRSPTINVVAPSQLSYSAWVSSEAGADGLRLFASQNGGPFAEIPPAFLSGPPSPPVRPQVNYPSSLASTIAVGASTDWDYRAEYSQYGATLDFVAPGGAGNLDVVTTDRTGANGYNTTSNATGDYSFFNGTSAATPLAAGIAALMLSRNPNLTANQIRTIMQTTADKIGGNNGATAYDATGFNNFYGFGRVNAAAALGAVPLPEDAFEPNDTQATATVLGSPPFVTIPDLSIHNDTDVDWFRYTAHDTGKLIVRALFTNAGGDIDIRVRDSSGVIIASSTGVADNEELIIPVVTQKVYFIEVFGAGGAANFYDLEIENFPAPVPTGVHLDPASDTGTLNNDNVTSDTTPTIFVQTDVLEFVDSNDSGLFEEQPAPPFLSPAFDQITALNPGGDGQFTDPAVEPIDGNEAGIAVEVTFVNTTNPLAPPITGFAEPIVNASPEVYRFTPSVPLAPGVYFVTARTRIFDGQDTNPAVAGVQRATGRSNASPPLWLTIESAIPVSGTFDLLSSSDTGMFNDDNVTNKDEPAFGGTGPANGRVRVFAQPTNAAGAPVGAALLVGEGTVGSDATDGTLGNGLGRWEVTVEPLADGKYNFFAQFENAAGTLSDTVGTSVTLTGTNATAQPIGNNATINSTITLANPQPAVVADVNVTVNITHPNVGDLDIFLVSPQGTVIELSTDNGGSGDNYTNAVFNDSAVTSITAGVAPFTGSFRPEQPLANLIGQNALGIWTLRVTDDATNDFTGTLLNWSITVQTALMAVIDTVEPNTPLLDLLSGPTTRSPIFVANPALGNLTDVNVTISISHPSAADLDVFLVSPSGTRVELTTDNGGAGANYTNTVFDDAAATSITAGTAPFTGTFRPEGSLASFNGQNPFGTWELEVTDDTQPINGQLVSWTLNLTTAGGPVPAISNTSAFDLSADTGRNRFDNITRDNTPTVTMTSTDPNVNFAQLLFTDNLKFRIFDRYEDTPEFLLYDSSLDTEVDAVRTAGDTFTALTLITEILPLQFFAPPAPNTNAAVLAGGILADGVHNLKLEVEDRAGNISHDFLLTITVDTSTPPVSFGLPDASSQVDGLLGASDTGVTTTTSTFADRVTRDTTPTFWGRAEANTVIRVFLDVNNNGAIDLATDVFVAQTVAVPYDGNDAYPDGYWEATSTLDLNQVPGLTRDGLRRLLVTGEDVAGNPAPVGNQIAAGLVDDLQVFLDTQGPQITGVTVNNLTQAQYDLFDPKPTVTGFTPLVTSLRIALRDLPARIDQTGTTNDFLFEALIEGIAETAGNYVLVGDHVGTIPIQSIVLTNDARTNNNPATATVELTFFAPLPDDRYTLSLRDNLVDPTGNQLDGESNAAEPQGGRRSQRVMALLAATSSRGSPLIAVLRLALRFPITSQLISTATLSGIRPTRRLAMTRRMSTLHLRCRRFKTAT